MFFARFAQPAVLHKIGDTHAEPCLGVADVPRRQPQISRSFQRVENFFNDGYAKGYRRRLRREARTKAVAGLDSPGRLPRNWINDSGRRNEHPMLPMGRVITENSIWPLRMTNVKYTSRRSLRRPPSDPSREDRVLKLVKCDHNLWKRCGAAGTRA